MRDLVQTAEDVNISFFSGRSKVWLINESFSEVLTFGTMGYNLDIFNVLILSNLKNI